MKYEGLENVDRDFATKNMNPGKKVYDEKLVHIKGKEYRVWNPFRSKIAAALARGLGKFPFKNDSTVLYLGAANGTTVSHLSDVCVNGLIYALEFSPRSMVDLFQLSQDRKNIVPILDDAKIPKNYAERVEQVDILYQDVAQRDQVNIFKKNSDMFLKSGGYGFLMVKARSVDVTMQPKRVFLILKAQLENDFKVLETIPLDPFEKDHMCIVVQKK